jgi:AcrR family transcriptional regulator
LDTIGGGGGPTMGDQRPPGAAGRPRSRRGDGAQLRAEILAGVNRLLIDWASAEKLTIRAVAREVGVAAPSIYLHFTDKAELVWAALADKYAELAGLMAAAGAAAGDDPRERLRAEVHAYCRFALDDPGHYRLMYEVEQPAVAPAQLPRHPARMVSGRLREAIARCGDAGFPPAMPVEQAGHTLWSGLHGNVTLSHTFVADGASTRELILGLADGLLGVLVPGDAAARAELAADGDPAAMRVLRSTVHDTL